MRVFVERPIATVMIFLSVAILGVYSFLNIQPPSSIGLSSIICEFQPTTNMEFARLELVERIARIRNELPYAANRPQIIPYIPEDFRTADFLHYTLSGHYSLQELREMLREKLEYGLG